MILCSRWSVIYRKTIEIYKRGWGVDTLAYNPKMYNIDPVEYIRSIDRFFIFNLRWSAFSPSICLNSASPALVHGTSPSAAHGPARLYIEHFELRC